MFKAFLATILLSVATAAAADGPSAQLLGINVLKALPDEAGVHVSGDAGTTLRVLFTLPGQKIISLDEKASKFTKFTDDKGTDLRGGESGFGHFPEHSEDHQKMVIDLRGGALPAAGATKIILQANIAFLCGSDPKTETQKDIAIKDGTKVEVGGVAFTFDEVRVSKEDAQKMTFTLKTDQFPGAITKTEFMGVDGKPLNAELGMSGSMGAEGGKTTYMAEYTIPKTDAVNIQFTYFSKVQTVTVPVNVEAGVGF